MDRSVRISTMARTTQAICCQITSSTSRSTFIICNLDGYQTFNHQTRNAGALKAQYKLSDKIILTGFSGVIWLDANTPNFAATRCQMYGAATA